MSGPKAGCPGWAGCPGHEPDVRGALASKNTLQRGFRGKNSVDFSDEIWGKVEEKRGTANPWNKFNKILPNQQITENFWGSFCGEFFEIGKNTTKTG